MAFTNMEYKRGKIEERWMEEHIKLDSGEVIHFENDIIDDNKNDLTWWTNKHNSYSTREAVDILNTIHKFKNYDELEPNFLGRKNNGRESLSICTPNMPLFVRPLIYISSGVILMRFGFLDGVQGFDMAFFAGILVSLVDAKLYEIRIKQDPIVIGFGVFLKNDYGIILES